MALGFLFAVFMLGFSSGIATALVIAWFCMYG